MQKSLFEKILLLSLGFLTPSSWIMGSSLTIKLLDDTVVNWALGTDIQLQLIHKEIDNLKQSTKL